MYYIGNVVKSVAGLYNNLNSATLTGAIDIVVVKQEDGTYIGSPFHVRFGKLGVVSSREKVVEIAVNDREIDLQMKLGNAGEAFFVEETFEKEIPVALATSPLPSSKMRLAAPYGYDENESPNPSPRSKKDSESYYFNNGDDDLRDVKTNGGSGSPSSQLTPTKTRNIPIPGKWGMGSNIVDVDDEDDLDLNLAHLDTPRNPYPLSDMDSPISTPLSSSPIGDAFMRSSMYQVHSDTEAETTPPRPTDTEFKWEWGMLPEGTPAKTYSRQNTSRGRRKSKTKQSKDITDTEGLLLDEVLAADKEVADMYLNRTHSVEDFHFADDSPPEKDDSPTFNVSQSVPAFASTSMPSEPASNSTSGSPPDPNNDVNMFDWEPRDVAFSLCGGLKDRKIPPDGFLDRLVSYQEFCSNPGILHDTQLVIRINDRYYNWDVAAPYLMAYVVYQQGLQQECIKDLIRQYMPKKRRGWFQWRAPPEDPESSDDEGRHERRKNEHRTPTNEHRMSIENLSELEDFDSDSNNQTTNRSTTNNINNKTGSFDYKKSLRLTSDQWKSLDLNHGTNKVTFTVTTRYQGTASCEARIFLWDYCDKLVISDIDGTITKSDVLGQILPVVGKDWSQTGVTGLFNKIRHNGYRFIYLSARAIGQAQLTRDFLAGIKQGELTLPDGPVLLTPTSLFKAFKKEVIERKPEEFKISCLRDIKNLYPRDSNPFYSGFGNRVNDVWAYRAVGIPISRVFTINYKGEIKHELTNTFSTSYSKLIELVDQMFPPISSSKTVDTSESDYTSFSFWRTPIVDLSLIDEKDLP